MSREPEIAEFCRLLAEPFEPSEVRWKPQMVKQNRALAIAYIDARLVMDRLDEVLGPENWRDEYEVLADGSVICTLSLAVPNWIAKQDVGSLSQQDDAGDRLKAAFSDALKRAAVKFGIGRYLYRLPHTWVDYDPVKKQITQVPRLPDWALPDGKPSAESRAVRDWELLLDVTVDLGKFNALMPQLSKLPEAAKKAVWNMVLARAGELGWEFDKATKLFVSPREPAGKY